MSDSLKVSLCISPLLANCPLSSRLPGSINAPLSQCKEDMTSRLPVNIALPPGSGSLCQALVYQSPYLTRYITNLELPIDLNYASTRWIISKRLYFTSVKLHFPCSSIDKLTSDLAGVDCRSSCRVQHIYSIHICLSR